MFKEDHEVYRSNIHYHELSLSFKHSYFPSIIEVKERIRKINIPNSTKIAISTMFFFFHKTRKKLIFNSCLGKFSIYE